MYKKFYMFDVWDRETEQYLTQEDSLAIFDRLKNYIPNYVHTLYNGPFVSWEHTLAFLKENIYGEAPCMEGIVIKRQDKLWSKSSRLPYYVKVVNEKFSEVHSSKPKTIDPEKLAAREAGRAAVAEVVTKRRISKGLEKLIEDNLYSSGVPMPDLLIRPGGEMRLSNFLLWQLAYSEFYFTDVSWPEFDEQELKKAIDAYENRDRRYGGIKEE